MSEAELRQGIVAAYQELDRQGMNKGASGNVSARLGPQMLITPSGIPAQRMEPDQVSMVRIDDETGGFEGAYKPSSEWRFHQDILRVREDAGAVVHTHAPYSTILAILRKPIPAVHYMIAAFGAPLIRVAEYQTFGTPELSQSVIKALEGANGCLMANHGMVVAGPDLARTIWLAGELELLANQYYHSLLAGEPHILSDAEIAKNAELFANYGPKDP